MTPYIAIAEISTGHVRHVSQSEAEAAQRLVAGTCFGTGSTAAEAASAAREEAERFRAVKGKAVIRCA